MNLDIARFAMMASVGVGLSLTGAASGGGVADAWVTIQNVEVEAGTTASVGVSIEVDELIGSFGFDVNADGLSVDDIIYDGPLFSLGWDGWDTTPSTSPNISAACIFPEDQVTGLQHLFTMEIDVPADAEPGDTFVVTITNAQVTNYQFQAFDVHIDDGVVTVADLCPADLVHNDGMVTTADLLVLLDSWGTKNPQVDLTGDGVVTVLDLLVLLESWGACP